MNIQELEQIHYWGFEGSITFDAIKLNGSDVFSFINSVFVANVKDLSKSEGKINALTNGQGKLISTFFTIYSNENECLLLVEEGFGKELLKNLETLIISEDATPVFKRSTFKFRFGKISDDLDYDFKIKYLGDRLYLRELPTTSDTVNAAEPWVQYQALMQGGLWNKHYYAGDLLTETPLINMIYDKGRGCFPGNETIAKIMNNRGPAYGHVLVYSSNNLPHGEIRSTNNDLLGYIQEVFTCSNGQCLSIGRIKREFRIDNSEIETNVGGCRFCYPPLFRDNSDRLKAISLKDKALELFSRTGEGESVLNLLARAVEYDENIEEIFEIIGVVLSRLGRYEEAIQSMEYELEKNPNSILAHTNLSLYYMNIGKIELAEKHKELAVVNSFNKKNDETTNVKSPVAKSNKSIEELNRARDMFLAVLEIDPEDLYALMGISKYFIEQNDFDRALSYLKQAKKFWPNKSQIYLELTKLYQKKGLMTEFEIEINAGILIAAKNGELEIANELQSMKKTIVS